MVVKELTAEKKELLKYLHDKVSSVKSDSDLKEILQKVSELNIYLDHNDSSFENLADSISQMFSFSIKMKIKKIFNDVFDKYDKKDKQGNPIYTDADRRQISKIIKEINEICDRNFWDRFKIVLGMGS